MKDSAGAGIMCMVPLIFITQEISLEKDILVRIYCYLDDPRSYTRIMAFFLARLTFKPSLDLYVHVSGNIRENIFIHVATQRDEFAIAINCQNFHSSPINRQ